MSLVSDVLTYSRQLCQTDSNGLTDTLGLAFANDGLENMTRSLIQRNIDASQIQESYTPMVAGTGGYAYPANKYALKTIEVNYSDTTQGNFIQASKMDVSNIQSVTSFDYVRLNQPTQNPLFNDHGDTFEIFPTPITSLGQIKIIYYLIPTEYSATGTALSYPQTLDYRCLGARVAALYAMSLEKTDWADGFNAEYNARLKDIINILAPQSQQPITPQPLNLTGWEY